MMNLRFKKLSEHAVIPTRATPGSAGYDLCSTETVLIPSGHFAAVPTGLAVAFDAGYEMQIRPRSGLAAKFGVTVLNAPGTVDSDYRGEVKVLLINQSPGPYLVTPGSRIAQAVFASVCTPEPREVQELDETSRGVGGFGSTGA